MSGAGRKAVRLLPLHRAAALEQLLLQNHQYNGIMFQLAWTRALASAAPQPGETRGVV